MKKVMIVAGGNWQCDIVRKAKALGHYVICSNLYPDSPAFRWADVSAVANVLDFETNLKIAEKNSPDAIITDQSDIAVRTVARLNEHLKLHGIGCAVAERFSNKYLMRQFCQENGFPCPAFRLCDTIDDAKDFFASHGKSVVKPLDSQSSRGVHVIDREEQLADFFNAARDYSICRKSVLIEEYIDGVEFTVDGIKTEKGSTTLAISEKRHYPDYPSVAYQLYFTERNVHYDYDLLRKIHDGLVNAMGLPFGLTHAEYIFSKGRFYLVEIAARGGGTNISSVIAPYMSGVDSNGILIRMALGEKNIDVTPRPFDGRCADLEFFRFSTGEVERLSGEDFLKNNANILDYRFNFAAGEHIPPPSDDSRRPGHFIAAAASQEDLERVRQEVLDKVRVIYRS